MANFPQYSALDFITRALVQLGVYQVGAPISAEDSDDAFDTLNEMIDDWGTQRLTIYRLLRTVLTLVSGTTSYTIGTGGTIDIVLPEWIENAGLVIDTGVTPVVEVPVAVFTEDEYARLTPKALTGSRVQGIYFDHAWTAGLGTIRPWPVPNVGTTQLVLYTPLAVTTFSDLSAGATFPKGYPRAIRANLALELAADFNVTPSDSLRRMAAQGLTTIKRANWRPSVVSIDRTLHGAGTRSMRRSRFDSGAF